MANCLANVLGGLGKTTRYPTQLYYEATVLSTTIQLFYTSYLLCLLRYYYYVFSTTKTNVFYTTIQVICSC